MNQLLRRVLVHIRRHRLFEGAPRALLAFSGGPDSVALALILRELAGEGHLSFDLRLAHLNHCLRGEESDAEEEFCRRFASERDMCITVEREDVGQVARTQGGSLEAVAREARYRFLLRAARQIGAPVVATGHQADDVAETVLLRLIRGAGVSGLGCMPPERPLGPGVALVRPLLVVRREELRSYLEARGVEFCVDSSNRDTSYTRNRVRRELIPALERDYPTFSVDSLCALNESALEMGELLQQLTDRMWEDGCLQTGSNEVVLDAEVFARAPAAVRKAAVERAVAALFPSGDAPALRSDHYRDAAGLAQRATGTELSLPRSLMARREHGVIYFRRGPERESFAPRELPLPGAVDLPELGLRVESKVMPEGSITPADATDLASDTRVYVNLEAVQPPLTVRTRRPGDRFHPLGAPGGARLKEFLINSKVPQHQRDRVPLVTDDSGRLVWVVGYRIGHPFRLTDRGQRVARLSVHGPGERYG